MDREPLFSIAMATYNRAHLLPRAIKSVLGQTYDNFELIIVDDASTDDTEAVCRLFEDRRISYHRQAENRGALATKNKGLDHARGDYLAFLDDDDELLPEALKIAVSRLRDLSSEGAKILWFDCMDFELKRRSGHGLKEEGYVHYEDLLCERVYGDFWLVMKRDLLNPDDRFDERLWGNEGYLWWGLVRRAKAYYVPKVLYVAHREHGAGRMSDSINRLKHLPRSTLTNRVFLEKFGEEVRQECPKVFGRKLGILGASQILNGEKTEGRKACLESFRYHVSFESAIIFLLSFVLGSNQIKALALNYMNGSSQFQRLLAKTWSNKRGITSVLSQTRAPRDITL